MDIDRYYHGVICFNQNDLYPKPYAKVKIFDTPSRENGVFHAEPQGVIKTITTGPGVDSALAKSALDVILERSGCSGIKVCASVVPYRTQ